MVAIVVHRATSNAVGTLDLHLPVALLDRTAGDVVLVGEQSGATRPNQDDAETSGREASRASGRSPARAPSIDSNGG